ncbi:MAG: hypothetical protein JST93_17285 [Acidobacteria bacterium]|nr:hypothetical protein [Acidobacteriota bacterium]
MPTPTREIWWLTALEATLFFSFPFWEITAAYAEPTTYPFRFAAAVLFVAIAATLIFHIAPAFLATKPIPTAIAIWLSLGYTERLITTFHILGLTFQSYGPWFWLAIVLILIITSKAWAKIYTIAALILSCALLTWAVVTTWHGHFAQNPHYTNPPDQIDGLLILGMLVSAAPAVLIARQIGQRAPTRAIIWKTGLFGICLPMLISVTAASLAAQAGATLHWRPMLFRSFNYALVGPDGLSVATSIQFAACTLLGPAVLSALALRSIAPHWEGRKRLWYIPLAAALIVTAGASLPWRPDNTIVTELAVPSYQLWALTIGVLFTCHYLTTLRKHISPPTARSHPANQTTIN